MAVVEGRDEWIKAKQAQFEFGMSGSPVVYDRSGTVCGVVFVSRDPATDLGWPVRLREEGF